ncbi:alpha/beta fold hydrolase [Dokdonella sp.]|uniref:alpha/beta hydrolase n=1 Tax=Dokdonella sp. TaxID=2291710 RepID=UPI0035289976
MRRWLTAGIGLLLVIGFAVSHVMRTTSMPAGAPAASSIQEFPPDPELARLASRFIDLLDAQGYEEAVAMTTPEMVKALGATSLQGIWLALPAQLGQRQARGEPRGQTLQGHDVVVQRLQFSSVALDARVVFDQEKRIAGFQLVPAAELPAAPVRNEQFSEREIEVINGSVKLPATLSLPGGNGPFAAIVLVHGSGPHDRDESLGPNKPFRDLAHGLAERGIAVLRYEKRTKASPDLFVGHTFTVDDETVDDALAAVADLRRQPEINAQRVFVAGHSLGAMMAPRIGERDARLAGLILLAAPAHKLEDIMLRQTRYLARLDGQSEADITRMLTEPEAQVRRIKQLDWFASDKSELFFGVPASYWLDLNHYDPIEVARSLDMPLLILQGERDYQVTTEDEFALWQAAFASTPRVKLIEYPGLGHTFMPASDPPGPDDYAVPATVEAKVIEDIAAWIESIP